MKIVDIHKELQLLKESYGDCDAIIVNDNYDNLTISLFLVCRDCESKFEFTQKDRLFFKEKKWSKPVRCKPCREKRKKNAEKYVGFHETMNNNDKMKRNSKPRKTFEDFSM